MLMYGSIVYSLLCTYVSLYSVIAILHATRSAYRTMSLLSRDVESSFFGGTPTLTPGF